MRFALFLDPGIVPRCALVVIFPLALRLSNNMIHEVPTILQDQKTGRMMLMQQHRISYMGLN